MLWGDASSGLIHCDSYAYILSLCGAYPTLVRHVIAIGVPFRFDDSSRCHDHDGVPSTPGVCLNFKRVESKQWGMGRTVLSDRTNRGAKGDP